MLLQFTYKINGLVAYRLIADGALLPKSIVGHHVVCWNAI